ncbi:MAG: primary-amine oxidase [Thermomicrobiales bacterium]
MERATTSTKKPPAPTASPLDPLTPDEISKAVRLLRADHATPETFRFVAVSLDEPNKDDIADTTGWSDLDRRAHAVLLDRNDGMTYEAIVSLKDSRVVDWRAVPGVQPAIMLDEFDEVENACKADPAFKAALEKRGITDMRLVCVDPWSAGHYGENDHGRRLMRALIYVRMHDGDNLYAHPVDNLVAVVDLNTMTVLHMEDHGVISIPTACDNYAASTIDELRHMRPLEITQPDGPGFTLDGWHLAWENWTLRVGFTPREGVVLHTVAFEDADSLRTVLHRASLAEMVVPYGDPRPIQAKKNAFDAGEYNIGQLANSLTLGCDCLGEIRYLDATVCDSKGDPVVIPNAICIHEEDDSLLWKHTDFRTDEAEVRRARRLVVSFVATVANYEYAFYWLLYQDGTIEMRIKLTGIVSTGAIDRDTETIYGQLLNEDGLYAPIHQHIFSFRLDVDIDGPVNSVYEVNLAKPTDADTSGQKNVFFGSETLLKSELMAQRDSNPPTGRHWKVVNPHRSNRVGQPTGYRLIPTNTVYLQAHEEASVSKRAGFAAHHLWVTPYNSEELYAAGDFPNQSRGGEGLPSWSAADRPITETDIVLWHTIGTDHIVRLEDWPIMPTQQIGFRLEPVGFFNRNPTLDIPPPAACHPGN